MVSSIQYILRMRCPSQYRTNSEGLALYVYNIKACKLSKSDSSESNSDMPDLKSLQSRLQYSFNNANLLEEAMTAAGAAVSDPNTDGPVSGNKRLALIGDAVLRLSVLDEWYPNGGSTGKS